MDEMVHHCRAASNGSSRSLLVGDLPFGSYLTPVEAARNGVRLVKEGRVDAVKLEGGARIAPQVSALLDAGVAVMGHIGLTPQTYSSLGGYRVQGRTADEAARILQKLWRNRNVKAAHRNIETLKRNLRAHMRTAKHLKREDFLLLFSYAVYSSLCDTCFMVSNSRGIRSI